MVSTLPREHSRLAVEVLARDIGDFFPLPLPEAGWRPARGAMDPTFVRFVESGLED